MVRRTAVCRLIAFLIVPLGQVTGCGGDSPRLPPSPASRAVAHPPPAEHRAVRVLRKWDERRAEAYASGSVTDLVALYVPGSRARSRDARLLQRYVDRGLVVTGLRMQLLAVDVMRSGPRLVQVRVTDRVATATVHGPTGAVQLPRDQPTPRTLTLRRVDGTWLMASVRPTSDR